MKGMKFKPYGIIGLTVMLIAKTNFLSQMLNEQCVPILITIITIIIIIIITTIMRIVKTIITEVAKNAHVPQENTARQNHERRGVETKQKFELRIQ